MLVGHDIAVLTDNKAGTKSTLYVFPVSAATKELTEKGYDIDMERITGKSAFEEARETGLTQATTFADWLEELKAGGELTALKDAVSPLLTNSDGAHNSLYRGANLGTFTADMSTAIRAGTFTDLFLGDYFTFSNVSYSYEDENEETQTGTWSGTMRLAGFDYLANNYIGAQAHHIAVVPDGNMFNAFMNNTDTTDGGYNNSLMHTVHMKRAQAIFEACFGAEHLKSYGTSLSNVVTDGKVTGTVHVETKVELMTEVMVYGYNHLAKFGNAGLLQSTYTQLPLFNVAPCFGGWTQNTFWLQDVADTLNFCCMLNGFPDRRSPTFQSHGEGPDYSAGVRPFALIY